MSHASVSFLATNYRRYGDEDMDDMPDVELLKKVKGQYGKLTQKNKFILLGEITEVSDRFILFKTDIAESIICVEDIERFIVQPRPLKQLFNGNGGCCCQTPRFNQQQ